jgi:predicted CXXCH cytochrome family protein
VRRLALLVAGAALWLILAAIPVLADGGIHVAPSNSGLTTLTTDNCAGCHRAHSAQGEYLLRAADANTLCLSCHGAASTGATADVMTGVQYALAGDGTRNTGTQIGALRDGGFDQARIDSTNPHRITYPRTAVDMSFRAKVSVAGAPVDVTSAHLDLDGAGGVVAKDVVWGNGAAGTGAGPTVELECTSCHNPHGNGQYRILNTLPAATGTGFVDPVAIPIASVSATTDRFTTSQAHGLIVGDIVTIQNVTGAAPSFATAAQYIVKSIPNGITFTVAAAPTKTSADITGAQIDITTGGTGGTVQRYVAIVDDAPLPTPGDERNYTVLQVRGYQGNPATYLLYASDVIAARGANNFNIVVDLVGTDDSNDFGTPGPGVVTNVIYTGLAHGFAVGDTVVIAGGTGFDGSHTIASIPSTTSFTLTGVTGLTVNPTSVQAAGWKLGTATKTVAGSFGATAGDYFHRTVPWNPNAINAACPNGTFVDSTLNPELVSACTTANDAPNGHPATVSGKLKVNGVTDAVTPSAYGQIAFNDQISAWCSTCHSRYYSSTNPNPGGEPNSSTDLARSVSAINTGTDTITLSGTLPAPGSGTITSTGFSLGDIVKFTATPTAPDLSSGTWYVVWTGTGGSALQFRVSATYDGAPVDITAFSGGGTVVRLYPAAASSWWFPRPGDSLFNHQHQTTTNRSCVTCHVSHGSDAKMPGANSGTLDYPGGTAGTVGFNSRLLKIDNRGTCQMCHDPTGTATAGQLLPDPSAAPPTVP